MLEQVALCFMDILIIMAVFMIVILLLSIMFNDYDLINEIDHLLGKPRNENTIR